MSKPLLNLCTVPPLATRDGNTGALARIYIPFYGYWYASGQQLPATLGIIGQDKSRIVSGTRMQNNYQKDCCCCGIAG